MIINGYNDASVNKKPLKEQLQETNFDPSLEEAQPPFESPIYISCQIDHVRLSGTTFLTLLLYCAGFLLKQQRRSTT